MEPQIASLLSALYLSAMSELLSANYKPPSTPSGLTFNPLENPCKIFKNICLPPSYTKNTVPPDIGPTEFYLYRGG